MSERLPRKKLTKEHRIEQSLRRPVARFVHSSSSCARRSGGSPSCSGGRRSAVAPAAGARRFLLLERHLLERRRKSLHPARTPRSHPELPRHLAAAGAVEEVRRHRVPGQAGCLLAGRLSQGGG